MKISLVRIALLTVIATRMASAQAKPTRQSWTADRADVVVGDIVTVRVDERLLASAEKRTSADDQRSRSLDAGVSQDFTKVPINGSAGVQAGNNGSSSQTGQASRSNRFVGDISVRVTSISPTGLLEVKGSKVLKLDKTSEELTLSGWIRPQDVSGLNTVGSDRIADAKVEYKSSGGLDKPKGHRLLRILGAFWP
jgi:flagellar L-ring protein precursor FlgH